MKQKIKNNEYKRLDLVFIGFMIFFTIALVIILSPIIVKCSAIKSLINNFLSDLGSFKSEYLNLIGGMIGSGLAVTSAIWIQWRNEKQRKEELELKTEETRSTKIRIIRNYINRELQMLWGLWIWIRYDSVYWEQKRFPFEPYTIDTSYLLNIFVEVELQLEDDLVELFYDLYYFSEKINQYIIQYNSMNYEVMSISSNSYLEGSISINTKYDPNKNLMEMRELIAYLIETKKCKYFFDNECEFENWKVYLSKRQAQEIEYSRNKETLDNKMKSEFEDTKDKYKVSSITQEWIINTNSVIPQEYIEDVLRLREINSKITAMMVEYENTKNRYIEKIETPSYSRLIKMLIEKLK